MSIFERNTCSVYNRVNIVLYEANKKNCTHVHHFSKEALIISSESKVSCFR